MKKQSMKSYIEQLIDSAVDVDDEALLNSIILLPDKFLESCGCKTTEEFVAKCRKAKEKNHA